MRSGYNWRNTLTHYAAIAGVMAGFCVTFIALILGGSIADVEIYPQGFTFGQISILFFGISTGLFISASEIFLHGKGYDVFSIPQPYCELLKEDCEIDNIKWADFEDEQTKKCRFYEKYGRFLYNIAIFSLFCGLFFAIAPFSLLIAVIISIFGIVLEIWQFLM